MCEYRCPDKEEVRGIQPFPLWLSPVQVTILPISEKHAKYSNDINQKLLDEGVRSEIDLSDENLGKKVRSVKISKTPYWIVIGDKDIEADMVTLESRDQGQLGQMSIEEIIQKFEKGVQDKK